ncbi:unnamed protein product [Heterotrigona itama]|uniref:L-serine deaminase n=1 Tax=Heterotrigona itama TaxID=395501 RepID=A0A6V7GUZ0_9HYME|nr:unnamed protein product [Heterotrigona itama]
MRDLNRKKSNEEQRVNGYECDPIAETDLESSTSKVHPDQSHGARFRSITNDSESEGKCLQPCPLLCPQNNEELSDPYCVEESPNKITFEDITSAAFKIKCGIINTPCVKSRLSDAIGIDLYLKKDFLQATGSFKERGARYALVMLKDEQKRIGVISASLGNHALALSYHGNKLGIPVTVVMPVLAPIMKIAACRQYGANVIVDGLDMGEAKRIALRQAKEKGLTYDHPDIMAGQGTLGLEIVEQVPDIDAVVVPIGGGGLIAGVALAVKTLHPNVMIIGVESERCPSFYMARKANRPIQTAIDSTLADGLAVPKVGCNAFATANPLIDKLVVVKEEWIAIAILKLVENEKCIVEGAGATGLAAILAGQLEELKSKRHEVCSRTS